MDVWPRLPDRSLAWGLRVGGRSSRAAGRPAVDERDFPDPFVLCVGSLYYAYGTNAAPTNVQVMRSSDLVSWRFIGDALPRLPAWAAAGWTWAPVVLGAQDRYVLYYTVRDRRSGRQAISVASASRPEGPFADSSSGPLIFQGDRGGSIDPSPFVDSDGTPYLLWKSDDNALDQPSSLWAQPLAPDGLTLVGTPTELLSHDRRWEQPLIEAPSMVQANGRYYLFYSANWWESPSYSIGYAIGRSPLGPFTRVTRGKPWFRSCHEVAGPGGQEFFTDTTGALRMAYHAWTPGTVGYGDGGARSLRIARVDTSRRAPVLRC